MRLETFLNPTPSKGNLARARLLEAAVEMFGQKGPEGATVREIARAAGQNVAAIAYYFGSKQKLYRAVMEGLVRELRRRLEDVFGAIENLRKEPRPSPEAARQLLTRFLQAVYVRLLSRNEAIPFAQLIVREQLRPSAGFEVLYREGFDPLHAALCFLVGTALGTEPKGAQVKLRTHMLMGQVYFFAMTRQGILRRMGWKDLEGRNAEQVTLLIEEHVNALVSGLASGLHKRPGEPQTKTGKGAGAGSGGPPRAGGGVGAPGGAAQPKT